jgi:hypothetical protein
MGHLPGTFKVPGKWNWLEAFRIVRKSGLGKHLPKEAGLASPLIMLLHFSLNEFTMVLSDGF